MIFAVADLLRYRFRLRHYGSDPRENIMALGHEGRVADETLQLLAPGDIIISQRINSLFSWATMYFGGYAVDHVAVYIGEGKVIHATLSGVKEHSINALARGARILPFRPFGLDEDDPVPERTQPSSDSKTQGDTDKSEVKTEGKTAGGDALVLPPRLQLLLVGIGIVLGLRPTSFKWRHYVDVGLVVAAIDLMLWPLNHFPIALTIWVAWLLVLLNMRIRFHIQLRAGRRFEYDSHPGLVIRHMWQQGGHIFPGRPVNERWKVRVWPAWKVLSSPLQKELQSPSRQSGPRSSAFDR